MIELPIFFVFKVLGDILEAIIGAVYLDCGMDLNIAWKVYTKLFPADEIDEVLKRKPQHPVKELMEQHPGNVLFCKPQVSKSIVTVTVEVGVIKGSQREKFKFRGIGENKASAKVASAKCALREFQKKIYQDVM